MGLRQTALLVVVAGGLAAGVWWTGRTDEQPGDDGVDVTTTGQRRLLSAETLWIRNQPTAQPIQFERRGREWYVVEPVEDLAARAALEQLVTPFDQTRLQRAYEPAEVTDDVLRQAGLAEPRATLRAEFEGGQKLVIELGAEDPLQRGIFVRRDGDVFLGSPGMLSAMQGNVDDFRERRMLRNVPRSTTEISVRERREDGSLDVVRLERRSGRQWRLVEPIDAPTDPRAVGKFLSNLLGQRADSFIQGNLEPAGGGVGPDPEPDFVLLVRGDAGEERLEMFREPTPPGGLRVQHVPRDCAFRLEAVTADGAFRRAVDSLRQNFLITFGVDEMTRITVDRGAGSAPTVFARNSSGLFELEQPVQWRARRFGDLMGALHSLAAVEFVDDVSDPGKLGFAPPSATLKVEARVGRREQVVEFGARGEDWIYARRADESYAIKVGLKPVDILLGPWTSWVDYKSVYDSRAPEQVRWLTITRGDVTYDYRSDADGDWRRGDQVVPIVEDVAMELGDLAGLEAVSPKFLADAEGSEFSVQIKRPEGAILQTYRVREKAGKVYVRIERAAVWFRIPGLVGNPLLTLAPPMG